jgi:hypothetical protein
MTDEIQTRDRGDTKINDSVDNDLETEKMVDKSALLMQKEAVSEAERPTPYMWMVAVLLLLVYIQN